MTDDVSSFHPAPSRPDIAVMTDLLNAAAPRAMDLLAEREVPTAVALVVAFREALAAEVMNDTRSHSALALARLLLERCPDDWLAGSPDSPLPVFVPAAVLDDARTLIDEMIAKIEFLIEDD